MKKAYAFLSVILVAAILYSWQVLVIYFYKNGVYPSEPFGLLLLTFGFGLISAFFTAIPMLLIFDKFKVESPFMYMIGGLIAMGLAVTVLNNGFRPWQHPEGFIIGGLVGLLYWSLTRKTIGM